MSATGERYSYSKLTTFTECPRKYEYRYVNRVPEPFDTIEAFLGRAVHRVLAWIYQAREDGNSPDESAALERFDHEWAGATAPSVRVIRRNDSVESRREEGRQMLSDHYRVVFLNDRRRTLGIEESFQVALADGSRYTGVIDRLARDPDDTLHVIDYKTTARPPSVHGEAQTLQIRSYGMGSLMLREASTVRLSYQYVRNGAEYTEVLDRSSAERTAGVLVDRIESVQRATEFPSRPSALCGWCGYREDCSDSGYSSPATPDDQRAGSACPRCEGKLRKRQGRFGDFLGCENYPECRYTRNPG